MTDPYRHPTPEEWREAYRIDRDRKAHERGLRALARIRALLAREPIVSRGTAERPSQSHREPLE